MNRASMRWSGAVAVIGALLALGCASSTAAPAETTVLPATVQPALPATSTISPSRTPESSEADPLVLLLIGDSVTYEMAPAIIGGLESTGRIDVVENTQFGFALSLAQLNGWRENWPGIVNAIAPDVVVIQTGIWDIDDNIQSGGRIPSPDSPDWDREFGVLLDEATFVLSIDDADILWMSMLPGPDPTPSERLNQQVSELAARNPFVTFVDVAAPFRAFDGTMVGVEDDTLLRKPDGVHLCVNGAERAAEQLFDEIERRYGIAVDGDWVDGPWRRDGRYDLNPCADRAPSNS